MKLFIYHVDSSIINHSRNPGYTSTFSTQGTYTHTIKKISSNICQFRLDFDEFEIIKPNINTVANPLLPSDCPTDTLTVKEVNFESFRAIGTIS